MADIFGGKPNDKDSPAKCGETLNQPMETPHLAGVTGASSTTPENQNRKEKRTDNPDRPDEVKRNRTAEITESSSNPLTTGEPESAANAQPTTVSQIPVTEVGPAVGWISVSGRLRDMEDAIFVRTDFCRPAVSGGRPLHFFAVYDGHGGPYVADLCKEKMHVFLEEELMKENGEERSDAAQQDNGDRSKEIEIEIEWNAVMKRCFEKMDEIALTACPCGSIGTTCVCQLVGMTSDIVGSTAVVAVLTPDHILVANCGDSRAVMSRGGTAIPLSFDQKPDRPDEQARIEAAGGRVIYLDGARVLGILAMSRALGDKFLKPIVISEPEVSFTERTPDDECLIIASDGLWDVLSNEMACNIARRCLRDMTTSATAAELNIVCPTETAERNAMEQLNRSRCSLAAALLTRLALGRGSTDNISVIVVDLKIG